VPALRDHATGALREPALRIDPGTPSASPPAPQPPPLATTASQWLGLRPGHSVSSPYGMLVLMREGTPRAIVRTVERQSL
jgi:hypothetical protein